MVKTFRELRVYRTARALAAEVYALSKRWPKEERYALTDQIRRSSRSVCANVAEAWQKRRYPKHFVSKLTDADAGAAETQAWLDMALDCGLIDAETHDRMSTGYDRVLGSLVRMMKDRDRWCGPSALREPEVVYEAGDSAEVVAVEDEGDGTHMPTIPHLDTHRA
ncbi:MAG: four helix bundle protein [Bacteroidota bacterium]